MFVKLTKNTLTYIETYIHRHTDRYKSTRINNLKGVAKI